MFAGDLSLEAVSGLYEHKCAVGGAAEQILGVLYGVVESHHTVDGGDDGSDAAVIERLCAGQHAADDGDGGDAVLHRAGADAVEHLAVGRLMVGAALAAEHDVDSLELLVKVAQLEDGVDAGLELGLEEDHEGGGQSAGSAGAGLVAYTHP